MHAEIASKFTRFTSNRRICVVCWWCYIKLKGQTSSKNQIESCEILHFYTHQKHDDASCREKTFYLSFQSQSASQNDVRGDLEQSLKSSAKPFRSVLPQKRTSSREQEGKFFSNIKSHRLSTVEFAVCLRERKLWLVRRKRHEWVRGEQCE